MAPVFGYWNIRGLGESSRMILHHLGIDFEDKRYTFPQPKDYNKNEWTDDKDTLNLEFPNLPYFIDGDVKISQSLVVVRYLAHKYGLVPTSEQGKIKAETFEQISRDLMQHMIGYVYYPKDDKPEFAEFRQKKTLDVVRRVSENLGDKRWFVDDTLSYADFLMVESLDHLAYLHPQILKDHPNIGAIIKRLHGLPNVSKYIQSGNFKAWPLYSPFARWGNGSEPAKREF